MWPFEQSETCLFGLVKILITLVTGLLVLVPVPNLSFGRRSLGTTGAVWVLSLSFSLWFVFRISLLVRT